MLSKFLNLLKIKAEERKQILLLLGIGFFQGVFLVMYQVSAESLFLNNIPHLLKEALLVSGGLGILSTALFSFLQSKMRYSKLAVGNLLVIFIITSGLYYLFGELDETYKEYLIFAMFVLIGPITAVIMLGFWGVFGRLFNLRQSKRIIGWIDSGQLGAAILAAISIPLLSVYIPETIEYIPISIGSIFIAVLFLIFTVASFDLSVVTSRREQNTSKKQSTSFLVLFKDNYVVLLATFLLFSMVTFTFVQYSFQTVSSMQYPEENELRNFLASFHLGVLILSLIMQAFVNDKILGVYGIKVALFILPILIGIFTILSIVSASIYGYSPGEGNALFIWFFLFVALTRLFNYSIRDALENPTFKLFFMPLDTSTRFDIQTKVEGVVNESSRMIAGLLIFSLSLIPFVDLIYYSYAVLFLVLGYMIIIGKLYNQYRNKIKQKLGSSKSNEVEESEKITLSKNLESNIAKSTPETAIFLFRILEKINPNSIGSLINKMIRHNSSNIRSYAQNKMNEIKGLSVSDRYVIKIDQKHREENGRHIVDGIDLDGLLATGNITKSRISKLSRSDNFEDRLYAAELIGNNTKNENTSYLIELLSDNNYSVRVAAIQAAEYNYNEEVIHALVYNISQLEFSNRAMATIVKMGEKALNHVDSAFYRTGQSTHTMLKILQIFGRVGGRLSIKLLWSKIDYPNKVLVTQVLSSLGECGFKAGITQISRIKFAIESDIGDIAWNIAALDEVSRRGDGRGLVKAIREENRNDLEHIYMLLGMLYESTSIQLVKENIESGTSEGVSYAIELLDVFLSDDLKQRIIPLLDDVSELEKAKKLEVFYPRMDLGSDTVLKFLINRDINQTSRWVKACAIYQIGYFKLRKFSLDIIANLFNKDSLILEISAWTLYQISPDLYEENTLRIPQNIKRSLDQQIKKQDENSKFILKYNMVKFLQSIGIFAKVDGLVLSSLVDYIEIRQLDEGDSIDLNNKLTIESFYFVYAGVVNIISDDNISRKLIRGEFIGEYIDSNQAIERKIVAENYVILFKISKENFYEILSDNISFTKQIIKHF